MIFKVSDIGTSHCEIRDLAAPISNDSQCNVLMLNFQQPNSELGFSSKDGDEHDNIELMRMKKVKKNNLETEVDSSTDQPFFVSHVTASCLHTNEKYLPQDFKSSSGFKRKQGWKDSPRQIISSYSSIEKQFVTFTLAPVDVRNCRLRLPMQFTRDNGLNNPGKIYLLGKDGSKWLANLLLEKRGRMTLGDGWKSFVKANGLKTGESITFKLNWEDTTPVLSLCPAVARDTESLPIEPSSGKEIRKDDNKNDEDIKEESESSTLMLTWYDTTPILDLCPAEARDTESLPIEPSCGKDDNKNNKDIKEESESCTLRLPWYDTTTMLGLCPAEARYSESLPIEPSCGKEIRKDDNKNYKNIKEESVSFENKLNWEDTTPMLGMCLAEYSTKTIAGEASSEPSEKESLPREPSGERNINKNQNNRQKSFSWERENMDTTSPTQNRFLTLTITPDCFKNGRLRLPLQFMMENRMNKPGVITLLGKDGTKWLANLLIENTKRMSLGKGWKDFAKANGIKSGDSITFEPFWEVATPVLSLVRIEYSSDRGHIEFPKESCAAEPSSGNKTRKAENQDQFEPKKAKNNNEESRKYPLASRDSSSAIQNRYMTLTHPHGIVSQVTHDDRKGQVTIFRYDGDLMYQVLDLGSSCCEIPDVPDPSSNNDHENIGIISTKMHRISSQEAGFSSYDGDDQENFECSRIKKVKKNNPGTEEAVSSSDQACVVHSDALYLPHDFPSSKASPSQSMSSYLSSEKQFITFTLAPVDVRHCRLRLPMQFARENGINKPGKIHLLGKDGSKWLANLNMESKGKLAVGYGWKSFVKANGLKTGESVTLKLTWEDTTPVLSLFPVEYSTDALAGEGSSEASEKEPLPIVPNCRIEIDEKVKEESFSWESEKNDLRLKDSTSLNENRFVTLTITPDSLKHGRLRLPMHFMRENNMNKPGEITLLDKDGAKWLTSLLLESKYRINLGKGWKDFAKANGLKTGDSITFESIWDDATPMLSLVGIESSSYRAQSEVPRESHAAEPSSRGNKTGKVKNQEINREKLSSGEQEINKNLPENRFLTLTLTEEDLRDCYLHFPSEYMKNIGINKPGKITLCGRNGMRWFAYLLSTDGNVSVGNGFKGFCEANGVMLGESFILEFILKEDTYYVFKFSSNYGDQICI